MSHSPKEGQEMQQSKLSKQASDTDSVNQDTNHQILFSKNNKRKAHTPTRHGNKPGEGNGALVLFVTHIITSQNS